jgi:hypothetical protein
MADSTSTSSGLGKILSKTSRRHQKGSSDSASNSIISTESDNSKGFRQSLENVVDKLKGHNESDEEDGATGIKKLVPAKIRTSRRRKKQEKEDELRASEEAERGRSVADRGTLDPGTESRSPRSRSLAKGSGDNSSLITCDSETES